VSDAPSFLIVDAMALAYRAFHAIPPLHAPDGTPTNMLLGFAKALRHLQERFKPTHLVVISDGGLPAHRMELLPSYKAQRAPMPDELKRQLPFLDAFLDAARIVRLRLDGEEADDVMATLARAAEQRRYRVVMASNDKDLFQLLTDRVSMVAPVKDALLMGPAEVEAKIGVPPSLVPAWLSLTGDAVDNIPGVPGIGPKTAAKLLQEHGSLDSLLANLAQVKGERMQSALRESADAIRRNLAMVTLHTDVPGLPDLDALRLQPPDVPALQALQSRLGMTSLVPSPMATQMTLL